MVVTEVVTEVVEVGGGDVLSTPVATARTFSSAALGTSSASTTCFCLGLRTQNVEDDDGVVNVKTWESSELAYCPS